MWKACSEIALLSHEPQHISSFGAAPVSCRVKWDILLRFGETHLQPVLAGNAAFAGLLQRNKAAETQLRDALCCALLQSRGLFTAAVPLMPFCVWASCVSQRAAIRFLRSSSAVGS